MTTARLVAQALALGVTAAGVVRFASLRGIAAADRLDSTWPSRSRALVILTLAHPANEPALDDWGGTGGTEGNRRQEQQLRGLAQWLHDELRIAARPLPYHVERGGTLLKDAATLAGLGVIGANNLLVTPTVGPRVRLRALALEAELEGTTAPRPFDPCDGCLQPCHDACPQRAFAGGRYQRERCARQMALDETHRSPLIRYCRACELACIVGATR